MSMLEDLPELQEKYKDKQFIEWKILKSIYQSKNKEATAQEGQSERSKKDLLINSKFNYSSESEKTKSLRENKDFVEFSENDPLREIRIRAANRPYQKIHDMLAPKKPENYKDSMSYATSTITLLFISALAGFYLARMMELSNIWKALLSVGIMVITLFVEVFLFILKEPFQNQKKKDQTKTRKPIIRDESQFK